MTEPQSQPREPGLFSPPLSEGGLAVLAGGETAFLSQGSFRAMATLEGFVARGNFLVPGPCAGPQPLKHRPSEPSESGVGSVPVGARGFRLRSSRDRARISIRRC
jgi:hypothetical protein